MTKINGLNQIVRSPHSPSPIYGDGSMRMNPNFKNQGLLRPGFTVGDLDRAYSSPAILVFGAWVYTPNVGTGFIPGTYTTSITQVSVGNASPGVVVTPNARAVKVIINVAGTGTTRITAKSAADAYTATVFDSGVLSAGHYDFYVGGWATPSADTTNRTYQATQYGPPKAGNAPASNDPTGDQELTNSDPTKNLNYVGGTYNPIEFVSLDGQALTFFSVLGGAASWDVSVLPIS